VRAIEEGAGSWSTPWSPDGLAYQTAAATVEVPGGFSLDAFIIDASADTATCPEGHTVTITERVVEEAGGNEESDGPNLARWTCSTLRTSPSTSSTAVYGTWPSRGRREPRVAPGIVDGVAAPVKTAETRRA